MKEAKTLRLGRVFEQQVFGVTEQEEFVRPEDEPKVLPFKLSMQIIITETWKRYSEDVRNGSKGYDPRDPKVGKTARIHNAVRRHLPRRVKGRTAGDLHLYISIGRTSMDWYHGIDAFFWWEGAYATVDASIIQKNVNEIKANFLLTPNELVGFGLERFSEEVATFLKVMRFRHRPKNRNRWHEQELD